MSTVTERDADAVPPRPVQVSVTEPDDVRVTVWDPDTALFPEIIPEATHESVFVEDQTIVVDSPELNRFGVAERETVGADA